jgi:RluA family pseudouridine synthase
MEPVRSGTNQPQEWVLYLDEDLLVANKPAGLPALPDGYHPDAPYLKGELERTYGRLWTVHRLDRETSGVTVLARNAATHRSLNGQFDSRQVEKIYHALTAGVPEWDEKTVSAPLRPDGDRRHRTVIDVHSGKPAETVFRVLRRFSDFALIEAIPHTGRTHQIRVHLAFLGLPLVGDTLYGGPPELPQISPAFAGTGIPVLARVGLHAWSLAFRHPVRLEMVRFMAPYPADLALALEKLRNS